MSPIHCRDQNAKSIICVSGLSGPTLLRCFSASSRIFVHRGGTRRVASMEFKLNSEYTPQGDQPRAVDALVRGLEEAKQHQVLLGVTGSGKTFSLAAMIERAQRPVLVMAHNKTLAAQLYQEFRSFFPQNAVEYFVSYYDYYQPEAYIPSTDTYVEKEATINDEIDRLRLSAT